jgi:hypothetical protein
LKLAHDLRKRRCEDSMAEHAGQEDCINHTVRWGPVTVACDDNSIAISEDLKAAQLTYTEQNISENP